jgi:hypothetical protein
MTEEKNDMSSGESDRPDHKKLLEYLNGSLSDAERSGFEKEVPENPFLEDAVEGLRQITDQRELPKAVNHLNQQLRQHLAAPKSRKIKNEFRFENWIYWTILVVLLLAIAGFVVLRFMLKK